MKERDAIKKTLLTTLIGELESDFKRDGIETSDELVMAKITKFTKAIKDTIPLASEQVAKNLNLEVDILANYMPKQLTTEELRDIIKSLNVSNMGQVMNHLKENYHNQYDGKQASLIARELIS